MKIFNAPNAYVIISDGPPNNPVEGQLWYNSEDNLFMIYIDNFWVQVAHRLAGGGSDADTLEGQNLAYVLDLSNATGTLDNSSLSSDVTTQGNTFNAAGKLVQLSGAGKLPNVDGSGLTNLTGASAGSYGTTSLIPVITVDADGRIDNISQLALTAYTQITDGTTTASASGNDTFKFRTADNKLSIAVISNDATHGDNVLFTINEDNINHDSLSGYEADEHVDHTSVAINGGVGLTGGGTIDTTKAIDLDFNSLVEDSTPALNSDYVATYDTSTGLHRKVLLTNVGRTDHGNLTGLGDDDHSQYSLANGTRWTTTPTANRVAISNGSGSLVVSPVTTTELNYLDGVTSAVQAQLDTKFDNSGDVNHDNTSGFVANEHINHSSITVSGGIGLGGGGTIDGNVTIDLGLQNLSTGTPIGADVFTFYNAIGGHKSVSLTNLNAELEHDDLDGFVPFEHVNHNTVSILAGAGLNGGGTITTTRSLNLLLSNLSDYVNMDSSADLIAIHDDSAASTQKVTVDDFITLAGISTATGHGDLLNLAADDHTQYSLANGTRWTTTPTANRVPISNGSGNLVVSSITDTELGYLDGTSSNIQTQLNTKYDTDTDVNHNSTTNYVANEHINHSTTNINAGTGLSGGGSIDISRTINLDFNSLTSENTIEGSADTIVFYDNSAGEYRKTVFDNLGLSAFVSMTDGSTTATASGNDTFKLRTANSLLGINVTADDATHGHNALFTLNESSIDHNNLTNYSANQHIDHSSVIITANNGLTGGGDITASRTLSLDIDGLSTSAPAPVDYMVVYDDSIGTNRKVVLSSLGNAHNHAASTITSGTFADARIAESNVTQHEGAIDHGSITGLSDDDHSQYSLANGTRWTAAPTANRVVISNAGSSLITSTVTTTELGYLSGVSSNLQTQLNSKAATSHNHAASEVTSGTFADARIAESNVTQHEGAIDHGSITGLSDDDHSQYSLADGTRWTTAQTANRAVISDGSGNLVVSSVTDTELGQLFGVTSSVQTQLDNKVEDSSEINHDATTNFVANEHVNHTSVSILSGEGITGGGNIAANRTLSLDVNSLDSDATPDTAADYVLTYDGSAGAHKKVLIDNLGVVTDHGTLDGLADDDHTHYSLADGSRWTTTPTANRAVISDGSGNLVVSPVTTTELNYLDGVTSAIQTQLDAKFDANSDVDHDATTNFVANEHINHSLVTINAGTGLSGGGSIDSSKTINLDFNSLPSENTVDTSVDTIPFYDDSASAYRKTPIENIGGVINHSSLNNLSSDDHTQYSLADGTRWTTTPTINRVPISDGSGNLVVSSVTTTELGYLSGVTSTIQTQLDTKFDANSDVDHGSITGLGDDDHTQYSLADGTRWTTTPTIDRVAISDSSGNLVVSTVTTTELDHLSGVTSAIQTQLDNKAAATHSHAASDVTSGTFGDARIAESNVTQHEGAIDHGSIAGLADDDHTQYSLADGTRWTAIPTVNRAVISDALGKLVVSPITSTELSYLSGVTFNVQTQLDGKANNSHNHSTTAITSGTFSDARISESSVTQHEGALSHDALLDFVANEHIDHTSVTLTAGEGLTGGGDISSNRTFDSDLNGLTADATPDGAADYVVTYDDSAAGHKKVLVNDILSVTGVIDHGGLIGLSDDDHSQYSLADGTRWTASPVASRVAVSNGFSNLVPSSVTTTELDYLSGVTSNVQTQIDEAQRLIETAEKTADYELVLADVNKVVLMNGTDLTLTVPTNANVAFPIGTVIYAYNTNGTTLTITGDAGVTVRNAGAINQYAEISLRKRATDEWVLAGPIV